MFSSKYLSFIIDESIKSKSLKFCVLKPYLFY